MTALFIIEIVICSLIILLLGIVTVILMSCILPRYRRDIVNAEDIEKRKDLTSTLNFGVILTKVSLIILLIFMFFLATAICYLKLN